MNITDYSEGKLRLIVRRERATPTEERRRLARRLAEIDTHLSELDKADSLLEGPGLW